MDSAFLFTGMELKENNKPLQCPECSGVLTYHPKGRNADLICDLCQARLSKTTAVYTCSQLHKHDNGDTFDHCINCLRSKKDILTFDLQRWLCRPNGQNWVKEVYVGTGKKKTVYSALPVQWEDIDRHAQSVSGDMIFDVIVKLKNKDIRYVIRPDNLTDTVQTRSASEISLPIGQVVNKPLRAVTLKDLLSTADNYAALRDCGLKAPITGELYEATMDDPKPGSGGSHLSGGGGIAFSSGCALMSDRDIGQGYEIEVYMYQSYKYPKAQCLAFVQTIDGTTASLLTPGKRETLRFAKDGKECDWKIGKFDTSTPEGKRAEMTGCDPATDMMIYFIPVELDKPEPIITPYTNSNSPFDVFGDTNNNYTFGTGFGGFGGGSSSGFGGGGGSSGFGSTTGFGFGGQALTSSGFGASSNSSGFSFGSPGTSSDWDDFSTPTNYSVPPQKQQQSSSSSNRSLGFAKHEMQVSGREFKTVDTTYPLRRIRTLPIRGFLRGALFINQTQAPTRHDAIALSDYLQTKYLDKQLTSIWGFTAQARARSKILPIFSPQRLFRMGTFTDEFTKYAAAKDENCVVCISETITHVLVPCGHMCLCTDCGKKWTNGCPICRAKIELCAKEIEVDKSRVKIIPQAVKGD